MVKAPLFFCDNCGTEVDPDIRACPQCGRFFTTVRCPACGFSGEEKLFLKGCPSCGYSAPRGKSRGSRFGKKAPLPAAGSLPVWVYILSVLAFVFVLAVLFIVIVE
jgi:predicted RNA-binding Zn-ribbon protein involved in translation (DUF1610 family)